MTLERVARDLLRERGFSDETIDVVINDLFPWFEAVVYLPGWKSTHGEYCASVLVSYAHKKENAIDRLAGITPPE